MENLNLEKHWQKKYSIARAILYVSYLSGALFVAYRILFPMADFSFSFASLNSLKNNIISPRLSDGTTPPKGTVAKDQKIEFNINPLGNFSKATISFTFNGNAPKENQIALKMNRSYQAFFYPTGDPVGFRNGTLLENEGNFYIISDNTLRKFSEKSIPEQLGIKSGSFLSVKKEDLAYNKAGAEITDSKEYPIDTLIQIENKYYKISSSQQLVPFVSEQAFLSQYDSKTATPKDASFLKTHAVSDSFMIGFADGILVSSDQSVFILSNGNSYPIADPETFASFGYSWDDVIAITPEELGIYKRQKQFDMLAAHPIGTIFLDTKTMEYYLVTENQKNPIKSQAILNQYMKKTAIDVDSESFSKSASCKFKNRLFQKNIAECDIDFSNISKLPGNDYQFESSFSENTKIQNINATFYTPLKFENLMISLAKIKARILGTNN
jgi:hypothetical protein